MRRAFALYTFILSAMLTGCSQNTAEREPAPSPPARATSPCGVQCSDRPLTETNCDQGSPEAQAQVKIPAGNDKHGNPVPGGLLEVYLADSAVCTNIYWVVFTPAKGTTVPWSVSVKSEVSERHEQKSSSASPDAKQLTNGVYNEPIYTMLFCLHAGKADVCLNYQGAGQAPL